MHAVLHQQNYPLPAIGNGRLILAATEGFGPLLQTSLRDRNYLARHCRRLALSRGPKLGCAKFTSVAEVRRKVAKDSLVGYHSHLPEIGNR